MKQLTNKEYDEYNKYKKAVFQGRIITPDGLRIICAAYNYDAEKIGQHFLESLSRICEDNI